MALDYANVEALHKTLPSFEPYIPTAFLPYLAFILLATTFALTFYFTTLPKKIFPVREFMVALIASVVGGFGVVCLFCTLGVYV